MQEETQPQAYRVKDFCRCYAISRASFYREVSAHRLSIVKRGKSTLVTRDEANRWFGELCKGKENKAATTTTPRAECAY